jgi:hypothetical protein
MKKTKNILWISLVLVWSFLGGAYFQLGYNREASLDFQTNFLIGGITLCVMFLVIGFLVYIISKKFGSKNPLKPTLIVLTLFTAGIIVKDLAVYDKVQKVNFIEDHAQNFVQHFSKKA